MGAIRIRDARRAGTAIAAVSVTRQLVVTAGIVATLLDLTGWRDAKEQTSTNRQDDGEQQDLRVDVDIYAGRQHAPAAWSNHGIER